MIKSALISAAVIIAVNTAFSQGTAINNTGAKADSSALLDLSSTTKGLLLPRMTTTERNSIQAPAQSLLIYNLTKKCVEIYENSAWNELWCLCVKPDSAGNISGQATVCQGQGNVSYNVSPIANASIYEWTYTGSGATINGNTESVTIDFSGSATSGTLTVYGSNSCGNGGISASFSVTVNPAANIVAGSTSTSIASGQTSITISKPSGIVSGDVMIAGITTSGGGTPITPPSGWVFIEQSSGGNCSAFTYYKVAGSSEPSNYTWNFTGTVWTSGLISGFRNVDNSNPINAYSVTEGYTASGITTTVNNAMLVMVTSSGNGGNTWTPPGGWSTLYPGGLNCTSTGDFYFIKTTAGPTGTYTALPSISDTGNIFLIALKPSGCP